MEKLLRGKRDKIATRFQVTSPRLGTLTYFIEMLQVLPQMFINMGEEELKPKDNDVVQMDTAVFRMTRG